MKRGQSGFGDVGGFDAPHQCTTHGGMPTGICGQEVTEQEGGGGVGHVAFRLTHKSINVSGIVAPHQEYHRRAIGQAFQLVEGADFRRLRLGLWRRGWGRRIDLSAFFTRYDFHIVEEKYIVTGSCTFNTDFRSGCCAFDSKSIGIELTDFQRYLGRRERTAVYDGHLDVARIFLIVPTSSTEGEYCLAGQAREGRRGEGGTLLGYPNFNTLISVIELSLQLPVR